MNAAARFFYVRHNECAPIGPFDTARDAEIARAALAYFVDWQTWYIEVQTSADKAQ